MDPSHGTVGLEVVVADDGAPRPREERALAPAAAHRIARQPNAIGDELGHDVRPGDVGTATEAAAVQDKAIHADPAGAHLHQPRHRGACLRKDP
jgi:hypothetical protein